MNSGLIKQEFFKKLEEKIENKEITREEFADFCFRKILRVEKCYFCGKEITREEIKAIKKIETNIEEIKKILSEQQKNEEIWENINNTSFVVEKTTSEHRTKVKKQLQKKQK